MNQPDAGKGGLNDNAIERFAHGFERIALLILVVAIAIITVIALLRLGNGVYGTVTSPWDLQNTASMQYLFGMVLTVLIALELGNSILRHFKERSVIIQAREVILIGLMAVVRKIMLIDMDAVGPLYLLGLAAIAIGLAAAAWLTREQSTPDSATRTPTKWG